MTAAAISLLASRGSSGVISRKTPEMKSLVDGSISTSDEMPYQDRPSSSARPIHISSDRFDHGGLVHSVSRKIRRVMRTSPPEELQSSRDCLFQLSILVSTSSIYFQKFGERQSPAGEGLRFSRLQVARPVTLYTNFASKRWLKNAAVAIRLQPLARPPFALK